MIVFHWPESGCLCFPGPHGLRRWPLGLCVRKERSDVLRPRRHPQAHFLLLCAEENEFILYATRKSIYRYDLASGAIEQLPLTGLRAAVALDFDYERNCLYWSDLALDIIQVRQPWVWSWGLRLAPAQSR